LPEFRLERESEKGAGEEKNFFSIFHSTAQKKLSMREAEKSSGNES
jgi:hypothetical protein